MSMSAGIAISDYGGPHSQIWLCELEDGDWTGGDLPAVKVRELSTDGANHWKAVATAELRERLPSVDKSPSAQVIHRQGRLYQVILRFIVSLGSPLHNFGFAFS